MDAHIAEIANLVTDNSSLVVIAGRDNRGVPKLTPAVSAIVHEASLVFSLSPEAPLGDALLARDFCAVSVLKSDGSNGYQIKGKAQLLAPNERGFYPVGNAQEKVFVLAAQEIFEVHPLLTEDNLRRPVWECEKAWAEDRFTCRCNFDLTDPKGIQLSPDLLGEIRLLNEKVEKQGLAAYVVTVNEYGVPNISPRALVAIEEDSWLFGDCREHKTHHNLEHASVATVALVDWDKRGGIVATGWVRFCDTPEDLAQVRAYWDEIRCDEPVMHANRFFYEEIDRITPAGLRTILKAQEGKSALCDCCN